MKGSLGGRNSPTAVNAALLGSQFWDGRAKDVEEQAGGPLLNPVEMANTSQEAVVNKIKDIPEYQEMLLLMVRAKKAQLLLQILRKRLLLLSYFAHAYSLG